MQQDIRVFSNRSKLIQKIIFEFTTFFSYWCFRIHVWLLWKMFSKFQSCQNDLTITNSIWFFIQIRVHERNFSTKKRSVRFYEFSKNCYHVCRRSRYNHELFRFILNKHCCQSFRHNETKFEIEVRRKTEKLR